MSSTTTYAIRTVPTAPIEGQKTGTSGLRKKVKEFTKEHYINNWLHSLFSSLPDLCGKTLVVGGDGRYWSEEAVMEISRMAAAYHLQHLLIARHSILSTPALSALVRSTGAYGGIILTASHNPGGPNEDFGIKYNSTNGGPAAESITSKIFEYTTSITSYKIVDLPKIDLSKLGKLEYNIEGKPFTIEIIDSVSNYEATLRKAFDFDKLREFFTTRTEFKYQFDGMNGVVGPYLEEILVGKLGAPASSIANYKPLPDFGGLHPDPNLTYAKALVDKMETGEYDFGAAWDGDADRNMLLGKQFFVNPSDAVAIIASYAQQCIPYFAAGVSAVARSMPTSSALDLVAKDIGAELFEVPTGWKFFGNIMDHYESINKIGVICGEESFGLGSDLVREKDGLWATLAWLSIFAFRNSDKNKIVSLQQIVEEHWSKYGRNFYSRHDFEGVTSEGANKMMAHLQEQQNSTIKPGTKLGNFTIATADSFEYKDQFDGSVTSNQGLRFIFEDGSRIVFRLSGTGSSGATIRLYLEQYSPPTASAEHSQDTQERLKDLIKIALDISKLAEFTGRTSPTVIT